MAENHRPPEPAGRLRGIQIRTPPNWWDLPLDPATRRQDIAALVEQRGGPTLSAKEREQVAATLDEAAAAAVAAGAVLASQVGVVGPGLAFGASVIVAVDSSTIRDLAGLERYVGEIRAEAGMADREVEVARVELPAGPAVRRRAIRTFTSLEGRGAKPEELTVQYFVPVPGSTSVAVVACGTPIADGIDAGSFDDLTDLYDSIAGTLRFLGLDDNPDDGGGDSPEGAAG